MFGALPSEYHTVYKRKLVTAATNPAVTTAEAKTWCAISSSSHDTLIANLVKAATNKIETDFDCALITQTWDVKADRFPTKCWENEDAAIVPVIYPVQSVTHIKYTATDGTADTTLATSVYQLENDFGMPSRILLKYDQDWPDTQGGFNDVTARLVCGYGASDSDVPEAVRTAILLMVKYWYDNPEDSYQKGNVWERSAKALLQNHFQWRL